MNSPLRNDTFRTVAYVEREINDGGNPYGGGRKARVSLALPADARLRHEIMPDARTGRAARGDEWPYEIAAMERVEA